jgi:hypothetical protein
LPSLNKANRQTKNLSDKWSKSCCFWLITVILCERFNVADLWFRVKGRPKEGTMANNEVKNGGVDRREFLKFGGGTPHLLSSSSSVVSQ